MMELFKSAKKPKISLEMSIAHCLEHSWLGQFAQAKQFLAQVPKQWHTMLEQNMQKIKKCQQDEKTEKKFREQLQIKLKQESRKSDNASQYVRVCNLAANSDFKEAFPAVQKFKHTNLFALVHSRWELQMLKWRINYGHNQKNINDSKPLAKLSDEGQQIKACIATANEIQEDLEKKWSLAFELVFNRDQSNRLDDFGLPTQIKTYMKSTIEMRKIMQTNQKILASYEYQIDEIYHNICLVENDHQMKMDNQEMLSQIKRKVDQNLLELSDFDKLRKETNKIKRKMEQIYDYSLKVLMQSNGVNIIAKQTLEDKIEQIKENISILSNPLHEQLRQEKSAMIAIEADSQILELREEVDRLKANIKEMEFSRNSYSKSFDLSDQECTKLKNLIELAKKQHAKIIAERDIEITKQSQKIKILENEKKRQPQSVDVLSQVDISQTIESQSQTENRQQQKINCVPVDSKSLIELIDSSMQTELKLRNFPTQTQPIQQNKQAELRQELSRSTRENTYLKQEIRQFKTEQIESIQHLFTAGGIIDIKDTETISYLATQIQRLTGKTVLKSKLLLRFDPFSKINMHQYIDNKDSLLILLKTAKGQLIACYSQSPCHPNKHALMPSLLISLTNKRSFRLIEGKKAIVYDPYSFIFGNHELRFSTDAKVLYSNFAIVNCSFNPEGQKVDCILGEDKLKQVAMATYEFYQVEFDEKN